MSYPTLTRPDTTELGDARRRVEQLVCDLPDAGLQQLSFSEPWEIRAFAMAIAAYHDRQFEWSEFQLSLITAIRDWEQAGGDREADPWSYYQHWVTALETVLAGSGLLSESGLDERTKKVLADPPNRNHHEAHRARGDRPRPSLTRPPIKEICPMTSMSAPTTAAGVLVSPEALSKTRVAVMLGITMFLALAAYYFVGVDEGMTSVFGKTLMIHEWVHDSRHFLGFPCH